MATGQTTTSQVASARSEFFDKTLLVRALPYLAHDRFGQKRPLPTGNSKVIKFRRYDALSVATTPLSEGVAPDKTQLSVTDVSATVAQYGAYVEITDMVDLTNVEPVLTETAMLLGEQAGQSLDQIWRDVLVAGSSVRYGTAVAGRSSVEAVITSADMEISIRTLLNNNAKMFTSIAKASDGVGTLPIRPAYFAIVHPDVYYTLQGISGFISAEQYGSQGAVTEGEVGAYKNLRFVMSTFAKVFADSGGSTNVANFKSTTGANKDVYATLIFGKDAYGITDLAGNGLKNIRKGFGTAGTADPLDQIATSGWKGTTVCKILNDSFMTRIENSAAV
jgi:N4-gp56 family major capsid protein